MTGGGASAAGLEFRLLGPLEVLRDGKPLRLGGTRQRALLALLLLHANEVVSSDRIVDELLDGQASDTAKNAVQASVSRLRRILEGSGDSQVIVTRAPGYVLEVTPEQVDLFNFERLLAQGREEFSAGDPQKAAKILREALAVWRGVPLSDVGSHEFAEREMRRLAELRLRAIEARIEADLALGHHAALIGELESLIDEHPTEERLRGQHMLALYRCDRQADALEAYQDARRFLVDELGIEPTQGLRDLHQAILRQEMSLGVPATAEDDVPESARGVLVGRAAQVAELKEAFAAAVGGRGSAVLLVGEPGIGKSRLAEELIRHARAQHAEALVGRCWEGGGAPAFWPWVQSIREYVRAADTDVLRAELGAGAAEIATMIPEVRERLPDAPEPPSLDSEDARFRLFDSTTAFLRNAAERRPLLLVLDDLHAADEPSLLLLRFLVGQLGTTRLLVVGTYRDVDPTIRDPLASTLVELAREPLTRRIHLTGLTRPDVSEFIQLNAGMTPTRELTAAIHDETEGNPLFIGEVVRLLAAEGQLEQADGRALDTLGIPQGVREVIGRRLRNLSEQSTKVLGLASVLGREFRVDVLERVSELTGETVLEALDEGVAARLVVPISGGLGRFRFAHALIRETLYDQLTTPRRILLHRRAAEALEEIYGPALEPHLAELTYHYFEAAPGGDVVKALTYAQRAAARSLELLAFEEAARFYGLALEILELKQPVDTSLRCELLLGLGDAQARAGDEPAASTAFLEAADIARSANSAEQLATAALGYGGLFVWMVSGMDEEVVPLLDDALRALGDQESVLRAQVLSRLSGALRDQPQPERRTELTAQAVEIARRLDDPSALAYALDGWYCAVWGPDNPEERLEIAGELLAVSTEIGDRERLIQGHYYRAVALLELGMNREAQRELEAMDRVAGQLRQPAQRWYVEVLRGILELFEGNFEESERQIAAGFELARRLRLRISPIAFSLQALILQRERGQLDEAITSLERAVQEFPTLTVFPSILASIHAEQRRDAEARAILEEIAARNFDVLPDNDKLIGWSLLGEVCVALSDTEHAHVLYELLLPYADRNIVCHPACAVGSASRYLGQLATLFERFEDAAGHFEHALEMNARMGARPWLAHTQEEYARMLLARGDGADADSAHRLLANALSSYRELGMTGALERASSLAQA